MVTSPEPPTPKVKLCVWCNTCGCPAEDCPVGCLMPNECPSPDRMAATASTLRVNFFKEVQVERKSIYWGKSKHW